MTEAFYRLLEIARDHLNRYKIMGMGDMYWAGRRDEAGYWRDSISQVLTCNEIELPAERLKLAAFESEQE